MVKNKKEELTVVKLVSAYNKFANQSLKDDYIKRLFTKEYIPYADKVAIAEKIIECSSYDKNRNIRFNSPLKYVLFILSVVNKYAAVKMDFGHPAQEYDLLNMHGIIEVIMSNIPEKELLEFRTILSMVEEDFMANHYENHAYISQQVGRVLSVIENMGKPFLEKIADMSDVDWSKLENKIINMEHAATKRKD